MAGKDDHFFVLPIRPELGGERLELDGEHKKEAKKETKKETTNLVGRLHACIGDVIVVTSAGLDIGGFVTKYDRDMIELSYENPHSFQRNADTVNRQYRLSKFNYFSILKKASSDVVIDPENKEGLAGKLFAQVGDIVLLKGSKLSLAGYLLDCNNFTITLSHENPLSLYAKSSRIDGYRSSGLTRGLGTYNLGYFKFFETLQEAGKDTPIKEK